MLAAPPPPVTGTIGRRAPVVGRVAGDGTASLAGVEVSDAATGWLRGWLDRALADLDQARSAIDAMNVFPVPDGDTGTNMYLTLEAAVRALPSHAGAHDWPSLARGALLGARGNSGVILAEYLRALAGVCGSSDSLAAETLGEALRTAAVAARGAVVRPVEGTILTVAQAAGQAAGGTSPREVAAAAARAAHEALAATPRRLSVLADAGVLDAGGAGLTVILDALARTVAGGAGAGAAVAGGAGAWAAGGAGAGPGGAGVAATEAWRQWAPARVGATERGEDSYEVMLLLTAHSPAALSGLRDDLDRIGDSVVIVGDADLASVHVHVAEAGPAIEAAYACGQVSRLQVTWLGRRPAVDGAVRTGRTVVATAHGPGTLALLRDVGAAVVPVAARSRPAVADLLDAARQGNRPEVVLLPGDRDSVPAAEAAATVLREEGTRAVVIPTRAIVQTLAALGVHDPQRPFDDDVVAMSRAAAATRYGALTLAERRAVTTAGICEPGDVLGVIDADIVEIGTELPATARAVAGRLLATGGELVTLVTGAQCPQEAVRAVTDWLGREHPAADITLIDGGQPLWPLIIGVE